MTYSNLAAFGKKFLVEPKGPSLTDHELRQLERLQPAAIMFRKRNFLQDAPYETWLKSYESLLQQLKEVLSHKKFIVSLDHEGGRVIRPPEPITKFPYAAHWAASAYEVGQAMALELKSLGVNVNFAPVADINSNPENPVINERAFGRTPGEVSRAAVKFAQAMQAGGIAPCAKHFPGHGDTKTDSHKELPVLELTLDELRRRELVPFQALIDAGIPMIMTAHILFPKIDPENQATLSRKILNDLLRKEMGFKGVVVADGLGMAPMVKTLGRRETVVKAVNASLDIFLMIGDTVSIDDAVSMAELLQEALKRGEITEETLQASEDRIDKFIDKLTQPAITKLDTETLNRHHTLAAKLASQAPWSSFDLSLPGFE